LHFVSARGHFDSLFPIRPRALEVAASAEIGKEEARPPGKIP